MSDQTQEQHHCVYCGRSVAEDDVYMMWVDAPGYAFPMPYCDEACAGRKVRALRKEEKLTQAIENDEPLDLKVVLAELEDRIRCRQNVLLRTKPTESSTLQFKLSQLCRAICKTTGWIDDLEAAREELRDMGLEWSE